MDTWNPGYAQAEAALNQGRLEDSFVLRGAAACLLPGVVVDYQPAFALAIVKEPWRELKSKRRIDTLVLNEDDLYRLFGVVFECVGEQPGFVRSILTAAQHIGLQADEELQQHLPGRTS